ncbi:unnamed protein product [Ectocarpus sp. CCAP 1310/34]|nr:unnamed protein product [Ectocarpus sp. CCAP 1310/34]
MLSPGELGDIEAHRAKTAAKEEEGEEEDGVADTTRSAAPIPSHGHSSLGDTDDGSAIPKNSPTKRKVATGFKGEDASGDKHSNRDRGDETDAAGSGKEVGMKEGKKQKKNIRNAGGEDGGDGDLVCVDAKEHRPGKKGMSLNPFQWEILRSAAGQIDANIRRLAY